MNIHNLSVLSFSGFLLFLSGCSHVSQEKSAWVEAQIHERIGQEVQWYRGGEADHLVKEKIQLLLESDLTAEGAVQIALLNSPNIQGIFEKIGISCADLVEAGLFSNPVFDLFIRYPARKHFVANIEYTITTGFIDLFLVPLRKKVAKAELEQVTLQVTSEVLNVAFEVERTWYELQAAEQTLKLKTLMAELAGIHHDIALRQKAVGNINSLDLQQAQSRFLDAELEVAGVQNEVICLKEKLNRLLGLSMDVSCPMAQHLSEPDYAGLPLERLEGVAFRERVDLQVARFEVIRLSRKLGVEQWWVYTDGRVGIAGERDPDGLNTIGPAFSGAVPIFNYGQAARMRLRAELRQAQDKLETLEIQILSEVREAHKLLMSNLKVIHDYREQILPLQNKILNASEELYNVMGLGVDRLLENKREQLQACGHYLLSLRDYWIARVQLDRALGGKLYQVLSRENEPLPWYCREGAVE